MNLLHCGPFRLDLSRPLVMGVVNLTPDSFSDGGRYLAPDAAIRHAERLVAEGADLLDLGAESTRPGAAPVGQEDELARLLPVLRGVRGFGVPVSVDTFKLAVMRAVLAEGAAMINDIYGLRQPGALEAVAGGDCGLCIMHMQRDPATMQDAPQYADVVTEVESFLAERLAALRAAGVADARVLVDPGFGFGKTVGQNVRLLHELARFARLGVPVLAGLSRKSMIGALTGKPVEDRVAGSIAAALYAVAQGAAVVRVHDVAATVDALRVWCAAEAATASSASNAITASTTTEKES